VGGADLLLRAEPAQGSEVAMGAEDGRPAACAVHWAVQVPGAVEAGQRLQGHILDGIVAVDALRVDDRLERGLLRQRPELGPAEKTLS
jgi:hypothetical protein